MDIAIALWKIDPSFYYSGNDYASLTMLDGRAKPSLESLEAAWSAWLNQDAKANALAKLEAMAEAERQKHITPGDGKAMAYQQQQREVQRWEDGQTDWSKFPIASALASELGLSVDAVLTMWQTNINAWLVIGSRIEARLAKTKADLRAMQVVSQADLDNFIKNISFS